MYLKIQKQRAYQALFSHHPSHHQQQGKDRNQHDMPQRAWWQAPWFGYIASLLLIAALVLIERVDRYFPDVPLFDGAPFGLISVLVALIWGIGPALFAIVVGLFVMATFLAPGVFTSDNIRDIFIAGPFVVLQLLAVTTVVRLEVARKGLLTAQRKTQAYARDLETANQRLAQMNTDLERANAQKDYVMMRASHELRTPVTTVLGRTQLLLQRLKKTTPNEKSMVTLQSNLATIEQRAMHLRALLDELFDVSSIHSGLLPLRLTSCDLSTLCRRIAEDQSMVSGRAIQLDLSEQFVIQADEKRLTQVLVNLVNNAVQYAPEQAEIRVGIHPQKDHVILSVHNDGPALRQEYISMFFEPFYRAPDIEYSPIQGWGLGLTISKEIVEQHKGLLWVESVEGKGTTFFVKLARQITIEQAQSNHAHSEQEKSVSAQEN